MPPPSLETVAELIREVARVVILPRWRNLAEGDVARKAGGGSLVTIADHEAEAWLGQRLPSLIPGSHVVGEEAVAADPSILDRLKSEDAVWVVDPIDGTRAFTEGRPTFDVMVALVRHGRPVAGWIFAPAEDDLYMGGEELGAVRQAPGGVVSDLVHPNVSALGDLEGIVSPGGFKNRGKPDPDEVRSHFKGYVRHTCAGHNYARLLRGDSHFLINFSVLPWDHLAGLGIARALGLHHARLDGGTYDPHDKDGGLLVAPDPRSWQAIRDLLLRDEGATRS